MRLKIVSPVGTAERRYGAWIGGSILASLVCIKQTNLTRREL